jgi:hypothetical protein
MLQFHPVLPTLLMCILLLYPLMKLYARVGLPRAFAFLIFSSIVVPVSGFVLVGLPLAIRPWPNFPKAEPKPKPIKLDIV